LAAAQPRRLFGAAQSGEGIGSDAGGVLGPAVIFSQGFFLSRESNLAELERFGRIFLC
jgi:hypothetical protein